MKNILYLSFIILLFTGCNDDFLDRYPLSEISPENSFKTANDLELYTNALYQDLPGVSGIVEADNISDNILYSGVPSEQTGERIVSGDAGSDSWSWDDLRKINIFFDYYEQCEDADARLEYSGVAYFFRAWFYYSKLVRFGDVPWYDEVIGSQDEDLLLKPRDSRVYVVEKMIEDLDNAISNLGDDVAADRVNKWTALALKSRVCLFEGTYRKYHTELNLSGADSLLQLAANASEEVIESGLYSLYQTGNPDIDYRDLFASSDAKEQEIMLCRRYSLELNVIQSLNYYLTSSTQDDVSLTKSIVNTYLNADGTRFTATAGYETASYAQEMAGRDPRLTQTVRGVGYQRIDGDEVLLPDFAAAISGYQIIKYLTDQTQDGYGASYQDLPIMRYAEVLLNFAEAKAELGTITQDDLDISITPLRSRVAMPSLSLADANSNVDATLAAQYPSVSGVNQGLVLEIRRERRIELVMEGLRYNDLMRWKAGQLLEDHFEGMCFSSLGEHDLDGDGTNDVLLYEGDKPTTDLQTIEIGSTIALSEGTSGHLVPFWSRSKLFDEAIDYLYPIPLGDILLNPNLDQNPGWSDR